MSVRLATYDPKKKTWIFAGEYNDGVFLKIVTSKHFMEIVQGYGIQERVIQALKEKGCKLIRLATPTGILESDFNTWLEPRIKVLDYGHGKQRFLGVKDMRRIK